MILHFPLLYRTNDGAFVMQPSRDSLNYLGAADPSSFMVARARNAECYTVPEVYWVDLR
jgi:hypothetical protein